MYRNTRMVLKLKRNNIQKKKKKKIQFHNSKKDRSYIIKNIIFILLCIRSKIGSCNSTNVASTRISFSVKHNHDYNIDP